MQDMRISQRDKQVLLGLRKRVAELTPEPTEPPEISEEIEEIRGEEKETLVWYQTIGGKWRIKLR